MTPFLMPKNQLRNHVTSPKPHLVLVAKPTPADDPMRARRWLRRPRSPREWPRLARKLDHLLPASAGRIAVMSRLTAKRKTRQLLSLCQGMRNLLLLHERACEGRRP